MVCIYFAINLGGNMKRPIKFALIGATGLVGRTAIRILEEKKLPIDEYYFLASSRSKDKKIEFRNQTYRIEELTEDLFQKRHFDYAIFSAGAEIAKHFAPLAVENGTIVIDNSNAFRMQEDIPLIVPEVNMDCVPSHPTVIANPNCSTIQAVVALKPLDERYHIKRIVYSTYQAVSGAGKKGLDDLENGIKGMPPQKFPHPIFNNCLPHIDDFLDNGYTKEEQKMIQETRKILQKRELAVTATTVRVPVFNCHCEAVNVEFYDSFALADVIQTLQQASGIRVFSENGQYPIPTLVSGQDDVFVGRIRRDFSLKSGINMWIVADNVRKGAATNAIQILEKLLERQEK